MSMRLCQGSSRSGDEALGGAWSSGGIRNLSRSAMACGLISTTVSCVFLVLLTELKLELAQLGEKIDRADQSIVRISGENEAIATGMVRRLITAKV
jgi:hypothetical protein